jgi:hypothetical protein
VFINPEMYVWLSTLVEHIQGDQADILGGYKHVVLSLLNAFFLRHFPERVFRRLFIPF